jgi:hypothetical protein
MLQGLSAQTAGEQLEAERQAYNATFLELELPWQWDAATFRALWDATGAGDLVARYIECHQPHLLKTYEPAFLRDLIQATKQHYAA